MNYNPTSDDIDNMDNTWILWIIWIIWIIWIMGQVPSGKCLHLELENHHVS